MKKLHNQRRFEFRFLTLILKNLFRFFSINLEFTHKTKRPRQQKKYLPL